MTLISAMLELNFWDNKDSFELKKKKLHEEYEEKMIKIGVLEPPEKWKKPPFMIQLMQSVQDSEDIIKKALFR